MEILVIDRESLTSQLISSKLLAKGHAVIAEPNKNEALEKIRLGKFDCVMVDPAPLSDARPVIIGVWKNITSVIRPYLLLLSKTATTEEAIMAGTNDVLNKPFSTADIDTKIGNAERLMEISQHLAREDNIHSTGGMIGKAAFNQLYLSAISRSFHYGERSLIVFISMTNYEGIVAAAGEQALQESMRKLTEKITFMRRQSDVVGRLGAHDFGILLQRPQYETEPVDAINRFHETLEKFYNSFDNKAMAPRVELSLVELPQGSLHKELFVPQAQMETFDKEDQHA